MFRTTIAALAAVAAVSAAGVTGVASAAVVRQAPSVSAQPTTVNPQPVPPTSAPRRNDPKDVGSAGIAGFDDATCEDMLSGYKASLNAAENALAAGDNGTADADFKDANTIYGDMSNNCLIID